MIRIHKLISSGLGIGYIGKGGGTLMAVVSCICWYVAQAGRDVSFMLQLIVTVLITVAGILSANKVEALWGKDDKKVVIDGGGGNVYHFIVFAPEVSNNNCRIGPVPLF